MLRLHASDAVDPAWRYSWSLLVAPRRWRTLLKVGVVAVLAQGGCNGSFQSPLGSGGPAHLPHGGWLVLAGVAAVLVSALGLLFFYVSSRLRFVLFDVMLRRDTTIRPIWRRYARQTWRWIGLKLGFLVALLLCLAPLAVVLFVRFSRLVKANGNANSGEMAGSLGLVVLCFLLLFLLVLAGSLLFLVLSDFAVPLLALEDCPVTDALRWVWVLVRAEPARVAGYIFVRVLVGFVSGLAGTLGIALAAALLLLPLGGAGYGLWHGLHAGGAIAHLVLSVALGLLALLLLVPVGLLYLMVIGYVLCFQQAYTLFFLGGRYPKLGAVLAPEPPPVPPPPGWGATPPPTLAGYGS